MNRTAVIGVGQTKYDTTRGDVFDEKVIRHHETFLVTRETQKMWPRARAEVHDTQELRLVRPRDVEHQHLPCGPSVVECDEQARALLVDA